jgi:hypothetical protein
MRALKSSRFSLSASLACLIGVNAVIKSSNSWILCLVAAISSTSLAKSSTH